jgi:hypothetical protein
VAPYGLPYRRRGVSRPVLDGLARYRSRSPAGTIPVISYAPDNRSTMTKTLRRLRLALSGLIAEDRPGFKRLDVSPARPDDGSWLEPHH